MKFLAVVLSAWMLVACGGGGSSSAASGASGATVDRLAISGTAATGQAIANATIVAKCVVGNASATTKADGTYSLVVVGGKLPCLLEMTNPADGSKLHTVATGSGVALTANVTPLTEMLVARALRDDPSAFFTLFDGAIAATTITTSAVVAAQTDVDTLLIGIVDTSSLHDFIATPLTAATAGNLTGGDPQDQLLDALGVKINGRLLLQVVMALAQLPNMADVQQTLGRLGIR
jgi:hypothetical protein